MDKCSHKRTFTAKLNGGVYCEDCGLRMVTDPPAIRAEPRPTTSLNWTALAQPVISSGVIEFNKVYIGARYNEAEHVWMIGRVRWCDDCVQFEVHQEGLTLFQRSHEPANITHYAPDLLGAPMDPRS